MTCKDCIHRGLCYKDGTIVDTTEMKEDTPDDDIIRTPMFKVDPMGRVDRLW